MAQQSGGLQRISLSFDETSTLGTLLFGPGVVEAPTASTGATTAGGTVSWEQYFEQTDQLGMYHVYYRQRYLHPTLGRQIRVVGTTVALHYAPDGSLRWVRGAQLSDVDSLPQVTLTNAEQAFAAVQNALATWPGFTPGNPATWDAGTMAELLENAELTLAALPEGGSGLYWRVPTLDAGGEPWSVLVDAASGLLLRVVAANPSECPQPQGCADCNAHQPMVNDLASANPENDDVEDRQVTSNPCPGCTFEFGNPCGMACTHEAAAPGGQYAPQIEVYHGMPNHQWDQHCGEPSEGKYIRVGLKEVGVPPHPLYDTHGGGGGNNPPFTPHPKYRRFAADAMHFTQLTMGVFAGLGRCGFNNNCSQPGVARVVVDGMCGPDGGRFQYSDHVFAPLDGVLICRPSVPEPPAVIRSSSAAIDVVAHEWGHAVSKYSPANFHASCWGSPWMLQACDLSEGFADVVGHIVEHSVQNPGSGAEMADWVAGEDWDPGDVTHRLRRADAYDTRPCSPPESPYHNSVHAEDPG